MVAVAYACNTYGRVSLHRKASLMRQGSSVKELGHLNSSKEMRNSCTHMPKLKRTSSTIGFPTQEYRLKTGFHASSPRASRTKSAANLVHVPPTLKRCHSLPSLHNPSAVLEEGKSLPPFFTQDPEVVVRRINPSRTQTRVKKLNVESSKLHSWTSQQLKKNRELTNLHIVQDLAIQHKNYGVNEIQHGPLHSQGMLYARYVVRSLAASAHTPEPGSRPITNL